MKLRASQRRTLILLAVVMGVHGVGGLVLDKLGLVEGLLSPGGGRLALVLPLAVLFYVARFLALFVAPGFFLGSALLWILDERAERRASRDPTSKT